MFKELGMMLGETQIENAKLKAENDELKKEIAKATMEICNQCGEKDDYNIPCKQIRDLGYGLQLEIEENDKLKQTLTEIKEYLKPYLFRGGVEPQWVEWQMAQREKEKMAKDIFQILQKNQRGGR